MKKSKKVYLAFYLIIAICTLSIVIACVILYNNDDKPNESSKQESPPAETNYQFSFGEELSLCFGDEFWLTPTNSTASLVYTSMDTSVLIVNQEGKVETKKCGETEVKIREGTKEVKRVKIKIYLNYKIDNTYNCSVYENVLHMDNGFATFNISFVNSKQEEIKESALFEIESSTGVSAQIKLGSIWVSATSNGELTFKIPEINYELILNIVIN